MFADVAAVDTAIIATLSGDATLMALLPDGIWLDVAPAGSTRFCIVQHQVHEDTEAFGSQTQYEQFFYRVTARVLESTGIDVNTAAYRIHLLLHHAPLTGLVGYTHMETLREQRIKYPELDTRDRDVRWQVAGGDYEVYVSPN